MSDTDQDASPNPVPEAVAAQSAQKPSSNSFKWLVANVALLSVASFAIGYLWLLSYARAEGIPLRVHADGVGTLVPWVAGTAAALLATPVAVIVMTAAMMRLPMWGSDASLHDYLRAIEWRGSADTGAMRLRLSFWAFGVPMFVSIGVLVLHVLDDWPGRAWQWFFASALISGIVAFLLLQRGASHVASAWSAFTSYMLVLLFVTGLGLTLPAGFALALGFATDGQLLLIVAIGGFIWWVLVSLIAFGKQERIREDVRGLALGSAAIVVLLSSIPDVASMLARASLRAMGIGSTAVDIRWNTERAAPAADGTYELVLDTGIQLYLRPCDETSEQRGVEVIAWSSVSYLEPIRKERCPSID